jgi:hypothetical protein
MSAVTWTWEELMGPEVPPTSGPAPPAIAAPAPTSRPPAGVAPRASQLQRHELSDAIRCRSCGRRTLLVVQVLDGLRIGDPACEGCAHA